jgi:hypothetical protein
MSVAAKWQDYLLGLQKAATLQNLSIREASLVLLVLSTIPKTKSTCDAIVKKLRQPTWDSIEKEELSDAALTVLSLYTHRPALVDGTCLAQLTNKMLASEAAVGGPYYNTQRKIDTLTNLAVSKLFQAFGSPLPKVEDFLKSHTSPRLRPEHGDAETIELLSLWPRTTLSDEMITRLTDTMPFLAKALIYKNSSNTVHQPDTFASQVIPELAYKEIQTLSKAHRRYAVDVWKMINSANENGEITMISSYFASSLKKRTKSITRQLFINLGIANFFTWMAYTIYDDFIDDEGRTELLPVANIMQRRALGIYMRFSSKNVALQQQIFDYFDKMDEANSWELAHCRFKVKKDEINVEPLPAYASFKILADRAAGHILGPMIIVDKLHATSLERTHIQKGFEHFLIARQLGDDLRDWVQDFQKGHISPVVTHMLEQMEIMPGKYSISMLTGRMREYLWTTGLTETNDLILKHISKSRRYFKKSTLLNIDGDFFTRILDTLEDAVKENALGDIHEKQFLIAYSDKSTK